MKTRTLPLLLLIFGSIVQSFPLGAVLYRTAHQSIADFFQWLYEMTVTHHFFPIHKYHSLSQVSIRNIQKLSKIMLSLLLC